MIAILDFGSQYTQLIARRVREYNVYSEMFPYNIPLKELLKKSPQAIILSGGPVTVTVRRNPAISKEYFKLGISILGICYGMQLMAKLLGKISNRIVNEVKGVNRVVYDISTKPPPL